MNTPDLSPMLLQALAFISEHPDVRPFAMHADTLDGGRVFLQTSPERLRAYGAPVKDVEVSRMPGYHHLTATVCPGLELTASEHRP